MSKVQGRRVVKTQSKESTQRQLLSAKAFERLAKRGEHVYLGVIRHVGDGHQRR